MKEFFKNLPDETTPYEADRFNDLLNGEESMGSIVVENIRSKNLYNPALVTINNNNYYYEFEIDNTKPYVFQSPYDYTLVYGIDASGNETRTIYETGKVQDSRVVTFVPNSNEVKIKCAFYTENFQGFNGVQLEQNNSVTDYSKHIDFECLKNNNYYAYSTASTKNDSAKTYCKIFEINVTKKYQTIYVNFDVIESENAGMMFNGKILLHNDYLGKIAAKFLYGDYKLNAINGKIILYLEKNDEQNVKLSVYIYNTNNWRTFITKINSSFDSANDENSINITNNNLWQSTEPSNISKIEV